MKVIGKDIGEPLDELYGQIEQRLRIEAERELRVEPFEDAAFSNVSWRDDVVVISLHNGVPTHALPHIFGVALHHVRQRLDHYPAVRRPVDTNVAPDDSGPSLVRTALRELVLAPESDTQLEPLGLDRQWEMERRHEGMKDMVRDAAPDWDEAGTLGNAFAALQYARTALQHPPDLWESLRENITQRMPVAAENGEGVLQVVGAHGWSTAANCLLSLVAARDELGLQSIAAIEDRRTNDLH